MQQKFNHQPHIGRRILAALIDYGLIYTFIYVFLMSFGTPTTMGGYSITGLPILIPIAFWLLMTIGLESGLGGTLGNSIVGLKAIPQNGRNRKLSFSESFKRHFLDLVDMSFLGLPAILLLKRTEKCQRFGDLWAKTIVVKMSSLEKPATSRS